MHLSLHSYRCHGEPKLQRPACLKGLTPAWELTIIGKKCRVFELPDGDIMLQMGELFCRLMGFPDPADSILPTSSLMKKYPGWFTRKSVKSFVYADAWCTIYSRNEGYIRISGLRPLFSDIFRPKVGPLHEALYSAMRDLSLTDCRFLPLGLTGCEGADSAAYLRLCEDIVNHYFIQARDGGERGKVEGQRSKVKSQRSKV